MPSPFKLYDSLSAKKELFSPLARDHVTMYCCGVTPYSHTHVGHLRTFFSYDLLHRALKDCGYTVKWARNITDVDDKIIKKANEEKVSCEEIVNRYVKEQDTYLELFGLMKPGVEPKVTDSIPEIIAHIRKLIEKEIAYVAPSGIYFRISKFSSYGKLSKNKIADLRNGVRIEVDEGKEDPLDFALWKFAKPGEIFWTSPWGDGRPGWHIECSAMIHKHLGASIDIHVGGRDLIFPHHECEIAQSESATEKPLASLWMHIGMVTVRGEKMSKSLNNFISISDFLDKSHPDIMNLLFLSTTYSQPLDFSFEAADEIAKKLSKIYRFRALVDDLLKENPNAQDHEFFVFDKAPHLISEMQNKLHDDLNTPGVLAVFFEFVKDVNTKLSGLHKKSLTLNARDLSSIKMEWPKIISWLQSTLGLLKSDPAEFFEVLRKKRGADSLTKEDIHNLVQSREKARQEKNWAESDRIRKDLQTNGILVQDTPQGPKWTIEI